MMIVYPNQKNVTVHKAPANKEHLYGVFNKAVSFQALKDLTYNEFRTFFYLATNQSGYSMALSPADIASEVGSTEDGIRKAVQGLIKKGYIVQTQGRCYDFYENPQAALQESTKEDNVKTSVKSKDKIEVTNGKSSVYGEKNRGEIINPNTEKSTEKYNSLSNSDSTQWDEIFKRIKVPCYPHTMKKLEEAAGCSLEAKVVGRIVSNNWNAFERGMAQKEGYRLNTLVNLLKTQYVKTKSAIVGEEIKYQQAIERRKKEPRINYDNLPAWKPKEEGLGDISALLEEIFGDVDDAV